MNNTQILCFILGYQGGTVHQVAAELGVSVTDVIDADDNQMQVLCRKAQKVFWGQEGISPLLLKHLLICVKILKTHYEAPIPGWLERAEGVCNIVAEYYPPNKVDV